MMVACAGTVVKAVAEAGNAETAAPGVHQTRSTESARAITPGETAEVTYELPTDPESLKLKERVEARWQALIDRNFDTAYSYESPAFRERYSAEAFKAKFGPQVRWHVVTVKRIRYDQRGAAKVLVEIDHDFFPPQGDRPVRTQGYLEEDWVNIDGHWWRNATQKEFELPTN